MESRKLSTGSFVLTCSKILYCKMHHAFYQETSREKLGANAILGMFMRLQIGNKTVQLVQPQSVSSESKHKIRMTVCVLVCVCADCSRYCMPDGFMINARNYK